mgnify:CR=1 FL=1
MEQEVVIRVQDLSKRYRLGVTGGATLGEELQAWWARMRGRPDPLSKLTIKQQPQRVGEHFWALRDISFEVEKGEILGVIGRNGAGKSTLLKLLSRITTPTTGTVHMRGRVSSLLEVGTGFNPELTGRENIFLNGAILGMKKAEITRKLDDIIAFSGIQHHIDSPVKRYSSGMKVRLGFAVAAHLEPEIMIIDEVLAVGDAEFQRKCLGTMKDVAGSGRTVLFVSHNMLSVRSLCSRVIWMQDGQILKVGDTEDVVREYLNAYTRLDPEVRWELGPKAPGTDEIRLTRVAIERMTGEGPITWEESFRIAVDFHSYNGIPEGNINVGLHIYNQDDVLVFGSSWREWSPELDPLPPGGHQLACSIPGELLNSGDYRVVVHVFMRGRRIFRVEDTVAFEIHEARREGAFFGRKKGIFRPKLQWDLAGVESRS